MFLGQFHLNIKGKIHNNNKKMTSFFFQNASDDRMVNDDVTFHLLCHKGREMHRKLKPVNYHFCVFLKDIELESDRISHTDIIFILALSLVFVPFCSLFFYLSMQNPTREYLIRWKINKITG